MIEIFVLVKFCKYLASIARDKNRTGTWGGLGAVGWIGGEISGAVMAAKASHQQGMGVYGYALFGAALGAVLAFVIVKSLSPIPDDNGLPEARLL